MSVLMDQLGEWPAALNAAIASTEDSVNALSVIAQSVDAALPGLTAAVEASSEKLDAVLTALETVNTSLGTINTSLGTLNTTLTSFKTQEAALGQ